jgi:hypothetical protein
MFSGLVPWASSHAIETWKLLDWRDATKERVTRNPVRRG